MNDDRHPAKVGADGTASFNRQHHRAIEVSRVNPENSLFPYLGSRSFLCGCATHTATHAHDARQIAMLFNGDESGGDE